MGNYEDFANWLNEQLMQRGWDQAELTRRSRISSGLLSRIYAGERHPGPTTCRAIARALHLPPEEVFRQAGLLPKLRQQPEGSEELLHLYTEMTEEERSRLLAIARTLHGMGQGE
jgi:transcriptional regulator with XRE-family HTH domain